MFDRTFAITYALEAVAVFVAVMGVAGALLVKLFGDPRREDREYAGHAAGVRDTGISLAVNRSVFFVALALVASLATAMVYGVGGVMAVNGALTVGTLLALAALVTGCKPGSPAFHGIDITGAAGSAVALAEQALQRLPVACVHARVTAQALLAGGRQVAALGPHRDVRDLLPQPGRGDGGRHRLAARAWAVLAPGARPAGAAGGARGRRRQRRCRPT